MLNLLFGLSTGLSAGSFISYLIYLFVKKQKIYQAQQTGERIIQKAQDNMHNLIENTHIQIDDYKVKLIQKKEQKCKNLIQKQKQIEIETEQIQQQMTELLDKLNEQKTKKLKKFQNAKGLNEKKLQNLKQIISLEKNKTRQLIQDLKAQFYINVEHLKKLEKEKQLEQAENQMTKQIKEQEEEFKHGVEKKAHFILEAVLSRFQQLYCPERSIGNVIFSSQKAMLNLVQHKKTTLKWIEKECGIDIKINEEEFLFSILGIDPVRRELGRLVLQKIANMKHNTFTEQNIKDLVRKEKLAFFKRIKKDGWKICHNLNLKNIHPKIKTMMGSLRYRYSFAQNQYFHCQEVGWLCGLLNAELKEPLYPARRAGMLHDIGKAMDHSKEGGHAVIGADFIEQHNEDSKIVYAVKAHHNDVPPEKPLDFLVIAADAISGARPGARRSTIDSYNQKMLTLEKIGKSFKGVKEIYIMSAGREIRVIVDSKKINDLKALELSKKMTHKIEEDCSYPGLIKVTVVRQFINNVNLGKKHKQATP